MLPPLCDWLTEELYSILMLNTLQTVALKTFSIPAGTRVWNQENLYIGQIPTVIIAFVDNEGYTGSYTCNPFNCENYDRVCMFVRRWTVFSQKALSTTFSKRIVHKRVLSADNWPYHSAISASVTHFVSTWNPLKGVLEMCETCGPHCVFYIMCKMGCRIHDC